MSQSRGDGEGGGEGEYLRSADRVRGGTPFSGQKTNPIQKKYLPGLGKRRIDKSPQT